MKMCHNIYKLRTFTQSKLFVLTKHSKTHCVFNINNNKCYSGFIRHIGAFYSLIFQLFYGGSVELTDVHKIKCGSIRMCGKRIDIIPSIIAAWIESSSPNFWGTNLYLSPK